MRALASCLHHPRPATGADDVFGSLAAHRFSADQVGEFPRLVIVVRKLTQGLGARGLARIGCGNARAAEHYHGRDDAPALQYHLEFQQFELQAHGAQLVLLQKIRIAERKPE
jgi:hypothetical protein